VERWLKRRERCKEGREEEEDRKLQEDARQYR